MRIQEVMDVADKGILLYAITRDPLTLSAAKLLLRAKKAKLTEPEQTALQLLQRQLDAYHTIHTEPLV